MSYDDRRTEPRRSFFTSTAFTIVFVSTMLIIAFLLSAYVMVKLFA